MINTMQRSAAVLVFAAAFAAASGCAALVGAGAGAAGVAYVAGELQANVDGTPPQVVNATLDAFEDMDIAIVSYDSSDMDGEVTGRTADDTRVQVSVDRETDRTSELGIRVGTFGDEQMSRRIYDRIRENLDVDDPPDAPQQEY